MSHMMQPAAQPSTEAQLFALIGKTASFFIYPDDKPVRVQSLITEGVYGLPVVTIHVHGRSFEAGMYELDGLKVIG